MNQANPAADRLHQAIQRLGHVAVSGGEADLMGDWLDAALATARQQGRDEAVQPASTPDPTLSDEAMQAIAEALERIVAKDGGPASTGAALDLVAEVLALDSEEVDCRGMALQIAHLYARLGGTSDDPEPER